MSYDYDLSPYGGPLKLAEAAGVSRMTLWRALKHVKCGADTAKAINAATGGAIPIEALHPIRGARLEQENHGEANRGAGTGQGSEDPGPGTEAE